MAAAEEEYERGRTAGEIAARLAGHDLHFATINGSLADMAREMHDLLLAVQRLGDQADASAKTVIATAMALEKASAARREASESKWSPWQKIITALAGLAALVAVISFLISIVK